MIPAELRAQIAALEHTWDDLKSFLKHVTWDRDSTEVDSHNLLIEVDDRLAALGRALEKVDDE